MPPERMPYLRRRRKRGGTAPRRALKAPERRSIEERPCETAGREEFGHWEMDTVVSRVSGRGGLLVLIERKTRLYLIRKIDSVSQDAVLEALRRIAGAGLMKKVLSVTTDNGSEFLDAGKLAAVSGTDRIYYTHAYAAWEKGSVENANRIVRRWYPKGTDFSKVSRRRIQALQNTINSMPRLYSLKGRSANEAFLAVS